MRDNRFTKRPVLAICISIAIVFLGLIGLNMLSVEKFPNIAPPTVTVVASYDGASAETVQKSVSAPLEEGINGVENMIYMESTSSEGSARINIYFEQGTDADDAAVNVQNKIYSVQGLLPSEVTKVGIRANKRQASTLAMIGLYSPDDRFDQTFISNYLAINIIPQIQRIKGVGEVSSMSSSYSMRIWLNPEVMAQYGLMPSDIQSVLAEQNIEASTGSFGDNSENVFEYTMKYRGRYETEEEFSNLVIRSLPNGEVLRLKDVAKIELGRQRYDRRGGLSGHEGVTVMINQMAGSNATEINNKIEELMENISKDFPPGLDYMYLQNTNDFLYASIREVVKTMIEAIILVVLVVFFFLQDYKLTLIPTLSLLVSLIGTFAALVLLGFSINLLTLFSLVLVIGTVVDDAIVVVEAVQEKIDGGETHPIKATNAAMHDITAAVVTTTLVFCCVFIPVSFAGGTAGTFYKQFGLTMAVAVVISAINALTLSPALCALMLKPGSKGTKFTRTVRVAYKASFGAIFKKYDVGLRFIMRRKWIVTTCLVVVGIVSSFLIKSTKTSLVPNEDTGTLYVSANTAPGSSMETTEKVLDKLESIVQKYTEVKAYSKVIGHSMTGGTGSSSGMLILRLKDWSERKGYNHSADAISKRMEEEMSKIKDVSVFISAPSMIDGYGTGNSVSLYIQDKNGGDLNAFADATNDFLSALEKNRPEISRAFTQFTMNYPQYLVNVDAAKCKRAGISPKEVLEVIQGYYSGLYASNFNRFSKVYRVVVQADPQYRLNPESLHNIYIRNGSEMAPISQFITIERTYGPAGLTRFNLFNAIKCNVKGNEGYSTGDVINAIAEEAKVNLPTGFAYEYSGMSREESQSNNIVFIFIVCVVLVYLVLSSLYESFLTPLAVILSLPFGLFGCFLFAKLMDIENNIYLQTSMIMIMGLLAKTAILITEYAITRRKAGMSLVRSAYSAALVRLRPILMTVLTLLFGMLPLLMASGAGANGNRSLGAGVIGGMLIGTIALLFVVPPMFIVFQRLQEYFFKNVSERYKQQKEDSK